MAAMSRPRIVTIVACLTLSACGTVPPAGDGSTPPTAAQSTATADAAPSGTAVTMHPAVVRAARQATDVSKMKVRLDAEGNVVKQSVYHGDASLIAEPVRKLAAERFPGATPRRYETEWYAEHGEVHEVEVDTKDGQQCELAAKPDGTELYVECHVAPTALPAAVAQAAADAVPGGKVVEAESKKGPNIDHFTVEVQLGDVEYYLVISPTGALQHKLRRIPAVVEVPVD